jgi:hypothetical protein
VIGYPWRDVGLRESCGAGCLGALGSRRDDWIAAGATDDDRSARQLQETLENRGDRRRGLQQRACRLPALGVEEEGKAQTRRPVQLVREPVYYNQFVLCSD